MNHLPFKNSFYIVFLSLSLSSISSQAFLHCLHNHNIPSSIITAPNSATFIASLNSSIQNPRININESTHKLLLMISPIRESHVQSTVICANKHSIHIRVRSGGHDYEGLSYVSTAGFGPFVLVDLRNLRSIDIDTASNTVWVQSGATLGELYYKIAKVMGRDFAFPAGLCPSVGIGGQLSGGGLGTMMRAFGLASDHIIDARLVNVNGLILDRKSMGDDHFWAIRGGGGCSFGVMLSFRVSLVQIPSNVTVFSISKTLEQGATRLVTRWQHLASKLDKRLFIRVILLAIKDDRGKKTVQATFNSLFLGSKVELLPLMEASFPELGLREKDCREMSWIESILDFSGYLSLGKNESVLLERGHDPYFAPFKAKSDLVKKPIFEEGWEQIWKWFYNGEEFLIVILDPFGGRMDEIAESETPFPYRAGNLYNLQYLVKWSTEENGETSIHLNWIRKFYEYMAPYVSQNPRSAYYNYRDLDLGRNLEGRASYLKARKWGEKYFRGNFKRLAYVKFKVDPYNFFRNEQSVPPLF